jgi:purine catabolism regulator
MQQRAKALESNQQPVQDRGAELSAPRSTPLTLVSGAVAGDDLLSVAAAASDALGLPVVIAIPTLAEPVVAAPGSLAPDTARAVVAHAQEVIAGDPPAPPPMIAEAVAVRIGEQVVGIVAALAAAEGDRQVPERRAWLEAAAAAATFTSLIADNQAGGHDASPIALLQELYAGAPANWTVFLAHTRRLGRDLRGGAIAVFARSRPRSSAPKQAELNADERALLADLGDGRVAGLIPGYGPSGAQDIAESVAERLAQSGMTVALSALRRDPELLHEALREAELLVELAASTDAPLVGQEETYRLLIGVLLRDPDELARLRARTISPLAEYDAKHDTDLLATLQAFLAHHGSTTETAEAMRLHRHTVGYRLARVHEVSGLSPYESDGRERLSLGLKAAQILQAEKRRARR